MVTEKHPGGYRFCGSLFATLVFFYAGVAIAAEANVTKITAPVKSAPVKSANVDSSAKATTSKDVDDSDSDDSGLDDSDVDDPKDDPEMSPELGNDEQVKDPYEEYNRSAYHLNKGLDKLIFKPVATVYNTLIPWPIKTGVTNVFNNLGEPATVANDLLQGKVYQATSDAWRFVINSTFGVLGLFDVAKHIGLPRHVQDIGLTFAHWGYVSSNYVVLPVFGPSTVRDTIALPINYGMTVYPYINSEATSNYLYATNTVSQRASLLDLEKIAEQAAYDRYAFERDAYLQRRQYLLDQAKKPPSPYAEANIYASIPQP